MKVEDINMALRQVKGFTMSSEMKSVVGGEPKRMESSTLHVEGTNDLLESITGKRFDDPKKLWADESNSKPVIESKNRKPLVENKRQPKQRQVESKYKRKPIKESFLKEAKFHLKDDLLGGITFEELVKTLNANEAVINEAVVKKVFKEILDFRLADAQDQLKDNMANIIKEAR